MDPKTIKEAKGLISELIGSFMGRHTGESMDLLANIKNIYLEIPEDIGDVINSLREKGNNLRYHYDEESPDLKKIRDILSEIVVLSSHIWNKLKIEVK